MLYLRAGSEEGGGAEEAGNPGWKPRLGRLSLAYGFRFSSRCPMPLYCFTQGRTQLRPCWECWACLPPPSPQPPPPASESWISQLYNEQATSKAPYNLFNFLPPHCWPPARCLSRRSRVNVGFTRWLLPLVSLPSTLEAPSGLPAASTLYRLSLEGGRVTRRCPPDC